VARKNALDYYRNIHMYKGKIGGIQAVGKSASSRASDADRCGSVGGAMVGRG
jgi:hypothetical protein